MFFVIRQIVMPITVNQYSVAYDVGLSQLFYLFIYLLLRPKAAHNTTSQLQRRKNTQETKN